MTERKMMRLSQAARKLNVGTSTIVTFLAEKGVVVANKPHAKIDIDQFNMLAKEFAGAVLYKKEASEIAIGSSYASVPPSLAPNVQEVPPSLEDAPKVPTPPIPPEPSTGEIPPVSTLPPQSAPAPNLPDVVDQPNAPTDRITTKQSESLKGLTVLGSIDLPKDSGKQFRQVASSDTQRALKKRTRKRMITGPSKFPLSVKGKKAPPKEGVSEQAIQEQIKHTLAKLSNAGLKDSRARARYRKEKRSAVAEAQEEELLRVQEEKKILKITEFISANDLASLMGVSVGEVISTCMALGMVTSINQRLDAEAITIIADEFGYSVSFTDTQEVTEEIAEEDKPEDLVPRGPIVTIMGHVDHGKTSLLDYIRKTQITKDEAGGITQHIGAYNVLTESGARIAFLDTPGHEAFTAMRARGARITDIVIIVVAADDRVMPQTQEAINHAQLGGVPIVVAINKIDKPEANPDRIKEELAGINILVEDWGGKYQSQTISAKTGEGVSVLLEKVLLEAELLVLKANPHKRASGTVIEASLDQGRGYVSTLMVQAGTLKIGDMVLAGGYYGKVKAMTDHLAHHVQRAIPSTPVQVLGLNGAPQAGDTFRVMLSDKEAREAASYKQQILREQALRTRTHITLDEIGRRIAIGNFKELNIVLKGDVDGSIEALSDALLQLSTEEIKVNIIHKGIGAISESDVLLASAADAVVIGFQVRPSANVRKLAEKEGIDLRLYAVIYDAINTVKEAMQGMLAPTVEEVIIGNATVREVFKISKIGIVAGCYVTEGYLQKTKQVRVIRDGVVVYTGYIRHIRRFKEDVQEIKYGFECGISLKNFSDIKVADVIEGFEEKQIARTLA